MSWVKEIGDLVDSLSERVNLANWTTALILLYFAWKLGVLVDRINLDAESMKEFALTAFATFKDIALLCAGYLLAKRDNGDAS